MLNEFSRTEMLIGKNGIDRLKNASVAIFGIGGVGSYTTEALARCGVGHITLIDNDDIAVTNINRQLHALHSTIGQPKVEVMRNRILDINPACHVQTVQAFCLPDNLEEVLQQHFDYVADAIDTVSTKISLAEKAYQQGFQLISCMGTGNKLDPALLQVSDIFKTSVCPLCRVMRTELKKRGIPSLKVVYSPEQPIKPFKTDEDSSRRGLPGSISFVPSVAGLIMAGEMIKDLIAEK